MNPFYLVILIAGLLMSGALWGLLPLLVGRSTGKPELGKLGMLCSILGNLIFLGLPMAVGFLIAILVRQNDIRSQKGYQNQGGRTFRQEDQFQDGRTIRQESQSWDGRPLQRQSGLNLTCLSGPLRGQIYPVGRDGLLIGRDPSCGVRLPDGTPGVSNRHCCIRWQQGVPVLIDLNSRYGTFQGNGSKLPPNYPTQLAAGSRFYLGSPSCLFQLTLQ